MDIIFTSMKNVEKKAVLIFVIVIFISQPGHSFLSKLKCTKYAEKLF